MVIVDVLGFCEVGEQANRLLRVSADGWASCSGGLAGWQDRSLARNVLHVDLCDEACAAVSARNDLPIQLENHS